MSIFVYPLLTSETINPNIIPGVCKSLEKYILVYRLDEIMRIVRKKAYVDRAGRVIVRDDVDLSDEDFDIISEEYTSDGEITYPYEEYLNEITAAPPGPAGTQIANQAAEERRINQQITRAERQRDRSTNADARVRIQTRIDNLTRRRDEIRAQRAELERELRGEGRDRERRTPANVDIERVEAQTVSLEPSWIKIETPEGPTIIGIKVVSYIVKSDTRLPELLLHDRMIEGWFKKKIEKYSRKINRFVLKMFYDKLRGIFRIWDRNTLTGDPKKDIIHDRSSFRNGVFAFVDMADLSEDFFANAKAIKRLFSLGWNTIVIADDINKRAYFALPEFKGTYTVVPYAFLYSGVNRDAPQTFENLEDVRKTSAPLFRAKGSIKKLLGESFVSSKISKYNSNKIYKTEMDYFEESFQTSLNEGEVYNRLKNVSIGKLRNLFGDIKQAADKKDIKKIEKLTSIAPKSSITLQNIESYCKKSMGSEFDRQYKYCQVVMKNSLPNHPEYLIKPAACLIAYSGKYAKTGEESKLIKESLKSTISKLRKSEQKAKTDYELAIAYISVLSVLLFGTSIIAWLGFKLNIVFTAFPWSGYISLGISVLSLISIIIMRLLSEKEESMEL